MYFENPHRRGVGSGPAFDAFARPQTQRVAELLRACPEYAKTPLVSLPALAARLGLGELHIKNEAGRFGQKSFKALGGAYAVLSIVMDLAEAELGKSFAPSELRSVELRKFAAGVTVACATDGNHGRSVAVGARHLGCRCVVFLHEGVSAARERSILEAGAEIVRVPGRYDDAVAVSVARCESNGWVLVSDTSWPGHEATPLKVMQGYTVMLDETLDELATTPTHIFLQAGVGGLAASVAAALLSRVKGNYPKIIVIEPETAACVLAAARAGEVVQLETQKPTIMAMLECFKASSVAWTILSPLAHGFATISDEQAGEAMQRLAFPSEGDRPIVSGESGAAGLAGLVACQSDPAVRQTLGLDGNARVLLFNTEGATDPASYFATVGKWPEEITRDE